MKEKNRLKKATENASSQFGYGMSVSAEAEEYVYDTDIDNAFTESMANFSASHANT